MTRVYKGHTIDSNSREIFNEGYSRVVEGFIVDFMANTNPANYQNFDSVSDAIRYINDTYFKEE